VYIDVVEQHHDAPNQEQVGWNPLSVHVQDPLEYVMTLQILMQNHIVEDRTATRTADHTTEVAVQDPSVCTESARNAECWMDLRIAYPMDQKYQQTT
jgi:hypothetical protein